MRDPDEMTYLALLGLLDDLAGCQYIDDHTRTYASWLRALWGRLDSRPSPSLLARLRDGVATIPVGYATIRRRVMPSGAVLLEAADALAVDARLHSAAA